MNPKSFQACMNALSSAGDSVGMPRIHNGRLARTASRLPSRDSLYWARIWAYSASGTTLSGRAAGHQLVLHSEKSACQGSAIQRVISPGANFFVSIRQRSDQVLGSVET